MSSAATVYPRVKFTHMPMGRDEANAFVGIVHRHAEPVVAEAAGYVRVARVKGREHDTPSRRRKIKGGSQLVDKWRWQAAA